MTKTAKKHRLYSPLSQWLCAIKNLGRHDLTCDYSRDCDGDHVCRTCGWTGQVTSA